MPITMTNAKKSELLAVVLEYKSILAVSVLAVETQACVRVIENSASLLEADTMLAKVGFGFPGIPFKAHDRSLST